VNNYYTYIYIDPSRNNEPIYIGKGKCNRAYYHLKLKGKSPFISRLKHMKVCGVKPIIKFIVKDISEEDAHWNEQYLIMWYGRKDLGKGPLLNLTDGGEGVSGRKTSNLTKEKMSLAKIGKPRSEEEKKNMRKPKTSGKPKTEEQRKKLSISLMGKNKGQKRSEETKKQMSLAKIGKPRSEEVRKKISEGAKLRWASLKSSTDNLVQKLDK
jgi:hypothetical protein